MAITEIKGWKLEDDFGEKSHAQNLGRKDEEHVPSRFAGCVFFSRVSTLLVLIWFLHVMQGQRCTCEAIAD